MTPLKSKVTFGCITRVRHVSQCLVVGDAIEEQIDIQLYHEVRHVSQCLMAGDAIVEQSDIQFYHKSDTCPSASWLVTPLQSKLTFSCITKSQTRVPVPHGW